MNMRRTLFYLLLLVIPVVVLQAGDRFFIPWGMKAEAFPAHVELQWNNNRGFTWEIYRSVAGSAFVKCGETTGDYFLDFFGKPVDKAMPFRYRIVPKGMHPVSEQAVELELKVMVQPATEEALLDMVQRVTTRYFFEFSDPLTGLARERSNDMHGEIVTTGGTGFGVMALVAASERGYYPRQEVKDRIGKMVGFLEKAERFHGAWAHWYDARTGKAFSFSKFDDGGDLVETALLMQGLLVAREYYKAEDRVLSERITRLWETVEWNWYTRGTDSLYWHWSKNHAWKMNHRIKGFDETLITYVLAASSPTYPISPKVYETSFKTSPYFLNGKEYYGIKLDLGMELGGPLFFSHYSFLGLDPRGLTDRHTNYFERNKAHTLIHRAYAIDNPKQHAGYGKQLWGFTSSDDPLVGYSSHHPGTDADNGTVSPTAALSSIVYTPTESKEVLSFLYYEKGSRLWGRYGFYDAYNPGLPEGQQVVRSYLAIDQGPVAVMMENYRSGLIWKLFMQQPEIKRGLQLLGFSYP